MSSPSLAPAPTAAPAPTRFRWWLVSVVVVGLIAGGAALAVWTRGLDQVELLTIECKTAERKGDWLGLERAASQLRKLQSQSALPLIFLAEAAQEQGRLEEAAAFLGQLPDGDPLTPPALLELSAIQFEALNRPLEAAAVLERTVRLDPRQCEARRRLIYFYAFSLQRRKMVEHARAAIESGCDAPETYVYLMGQDWLSFANAFDENSRWLAGNPDEELFLVARAMYRITSKALDETDEPEKAGVYDDQGNAIHRQKVAEYFVRFPQNLELLVYYLKEASTNGDADEVARLLAQAPPESADDNRFWRYMGWLHAHKGEYLEAENCYQRALTINPYDFVTQHQLAAVERKLNRPDQVVTLEELVRVGHGLRREILQLPTVTDVPPELLRRMALHAAACGDPTTANRLFARVGTE